ncbi:hypothetical protein OIU76_029865, partial [Salix suchowensis]
MEVERAGECGCCGGRSGRKRKRDRWGCSVRREDETVSAGAEGRLEMAEVAGFNSYCLLSRINHTVVITK